MSNASLVLGVRSTHESKSIKLSLAEVELLSGQHLEQTGPPALVGGHLTAFAETFADLADAEIMKAAWE